VLSFPLAMGTLVDVVKAEVASLVSKEEATKQQISEGCKLIIEQATEIADKRAAYGDDAARELFAACESSLKGQLKAAAEHKAQYAALRAVGSRIAADSSPQAVQDAYSAAVADQNVTDEEALFADDPKLAELRKIISKSDRAAARGDGDVPSGSRDDEDMDDEGFSMTQATSSHKCPLLQVQMMEAGELRPVRAGPCGHVFSYKGAYETLKKAKGGTMPCPMHGCSMKLNLASLVDAKDVAKEIKKAALLSRQGDLD